MIIIPVCYAVTNGNEPGESLEFSEPGTYVVQDVPKVSDRPLYNLFRFPVLTKVPLLVCGALVRRGFRCFHLGNELIYHPQSQSVRDSTENRNVH